jgi:hypothetical protein
MAKDPPVRQVTRTPFPAGKPCEAAQRPVLRGPNGRIIDVASLIG